MQVSFVRSYRSQNGNVTFVYNVAGSDADLSAYKKAQGKFYREDESGTPLWFTTRFIGDHGKLIITASGKIVPDMSEFDKQASLVEQFGGNFGAELAKASVANLLGNKKASAQQTEQPAPQSEAKPEGLGDI